MYKSGILNFHPGSQAKQSDGPCVIPGLLGDTEQCGLGKKKKLLARVKSAASVRISGADTLYDMEMD